MECEYLFCFAQATVTILYPDGSEHGACAAHASEDIWPAMSVAVG